MQTKVRGIKSSADVEVDLKATDGGILCVMPYQVLWTAKGYGWQAMSTAAVAGVVVRPGVASLATLWNGEASGGKSYVIERIIVHQLVSGTAQSMFGLWVCSHPTGMAAVTNDITVRNNTRGLAAVSTNSRFDLDATVVDDGWFPWGPWGEVEEVGVLPGCSFHAEVGGRIIVPPTAGISVHVLAGTTDEDFCVGFHWFEVPAAELAME